MGGIDLGRAFAPHEQLDADQGAFPSPERAIAKNQTAQDGLNHGQEMKLNNDSF